MEQREIEIFLTLADELHFGRAAQRLHVSTSRVSQTIKKLERRIGAPLFDRTSRRVALTAIGADLRHELEPAYRRIHEALERATTAARGVSGTLRVGFIGAASGQFVVEVAKVFGAEHPDCEVSVRELQFGDGFAPLHRGDVDMVLATLPPVGAGRSGLAAGSVLVEERQMLAVSVHHAFARRPSVSFADLARCTVLRTPPGTADYWDRALLPPRSPDGSPVRRGPSFATTQEMLALVGADIGTYPVSTQFTSHYTRPDVAYVPIDDAEPYQRRFHWPAAAETATIRTFDRVAAALADPGEGHVAGTPVPASWRSAAPSEMPAGEEDAPWPKSRSSTRPR